jgi:hypothetical protein
MTRRLLLLSDSARQTVRIQLVLIASHPRDPCDPAHRLSFGLSMFVCSILLLIIACISASTYLPRFFPARETCM